ncbi:hypothetical protein IVB30_40085 [Bradyrhizobium sp. 200]|uniref:hypothetical protein n=1 Tax=Bradyrhizobium sp. 200 TaxID=2782665 RepID=UPI001FFEC4AA|nr:hypothetical protein [Bradyrhizobium sp. 200]UPJ49103.1 hypothetical protein IVB30_40085 [Bradyrhizobium sp. 200]
MDIRNNPYAFFGTGIGITQDASRDARRHTNKAIFTLSSIAFGRYFLRMTCGQTLGVCPEGKPVPLRANAALRVQAMRYWHNARVT